MIEKPTQRDVYVAIMRAAAQGKGLRLTADECWDLSMDDAIATRATNALFPEESSRLENGNDTAGFWKTTKQPLNWLTE